MPAQITSIAASEFQQRYQEASSKLTIIDLRTHAEVETECLQGTVHFPVQTLSSIALQAHLDQQGHSADQPIYLLCAGGPRASLAAEKLKTDLDAQLVIITGGLNALKQLGVEADKGAGNIISLERQVRIAAGSLVVIGALLGLLVNSWFYGLSAFVGAGLVFAGITDTCGMGMILARMPWNRAASE